MIVLYHHYAHMCIGLDDETQQQLSRIEAMLNAICNKQGIVPDTLPGYDHCQPPSLSSHSPSSIGSASIERCHLFNLMRCKQLVNTLEVFMERLCTTERIWWKLIVWRMRISSYRSMLTKNCPRTGWDDGSVGKRWGKNLCKSKVLSSVQNRFKSFWN